MQARLAVPKPADCAATAAILEDVSRRAQRDAGLTRYLRPVVLATPGGAGVRRAGDGRRIPRRAAGRRVGRCTSPTVRPTAASPTLAGAPRTGRSGSTPPSAHTLRTPLEEALSVAAREPTHDGTPVQRWLRHFDLPLTAAWSSRPRGMLVLLSPARGWRQPEEALAQRLATAGVHVVGIDALQSFWQRRSPRDVALELQRLTDALASTGLPVYIGGREFGAETMAVAGEMMASTRKIAGVVLVDPGPTAFFEVEPPALALRPDRPERLVDPRGGDAARATDAVRDARRAGRRLAVVPIAGGTRTGDAGADRRRRGSARQHDRALHPRAVGWSRKDRVPSARASCGTASTGTGDAHNTR